MTSFFRNLLILSCFLVLLTSGSSARAIDLSPRTRAVCSMLIRKVKVDLWLVDRDLGVPFSAISPTGQVFEFQLQKKLGSGYNGTVYSVQGSSPIFSGSKVAKFGNLYRWSGGSSPEESSLQKEWDDSVLIQSFRQISGMEVPVLPVDGIFQSDLGLFLLKPFAKGLFLPDIRARYGSSLSGIPLQMKNSLRELFRFVQILNQRVSVRTGASSIGFQMDIKPENLFWVEDRQVLKELGLGSPQFVLLEATHSKHLPWVYSAENMSEESYLKIFEVYLKAQ